MRSPDANFAALAYFGPAFLGWLGVLAFPVGYIFYTSLNGTGFSLEAYRYLIASGLFSAVAGNTIIISVSATFLSIILGFAVALHLARQNPRQRSLWMMLVLLPFWTSILVKTYAFTVLFGNEGIVNSALSWLYGSKITIPMMYNRVGVLIGMTNFLIPFTVLPILASLLSIDPAIYRAATLMGAGSTRILLRITLPLSVPGVAAAASTSMIISLGFFIIPALLGGRKDMMLANLVDFYTRETLNWQAASAISVMLLVSVMLLSVPPMLLKRRAAREGKTA